ncbi:TAXI family TRAP transporter solute-binding subunit [Ureibacillus sp. Re31]|uniref:TAXI family TRAP transporter solute-binding subunit n=1 Tax=Ureibacillus galli TaxID=2762222 RepID=A0ABR8XDY2_9BACL|nr:TAXI family TRAP transporter solute-binding subunit [Ureibacillus galli]MBD8027460.1 TAXI family TRAP transporter solute-binding subunit [Ureibacillus galli]
MKRNLFVTVLLCLGLLMGCQSNVERYGEPLIFTTGTTTGVFYSLGAGLSTLWTKEMEQLVASQASNGSVENLNLMSKGEANLAFTTVNIAYDAYNGEGSFKGKQYDGVRILGNLYPNVSHIVVVDNEDIQSIEDLKGKSFVFGAAGSSTELESKLVLEAHGVSIDDVNANYVGFTEATDLIRNGQVDGVNIYSGVPAAATTELISTIDSKVLSFSPDAIDQLVKEYPWNFKYVIEANTYDKQPEPITTVGQYSTIVIDESVSEDAAYRLTKLLWENVDELKESYSIANQFDPQKAIEGTAGVPLHPGAEKYYKEIGVLE